jgi:hypothetical protein
MPDQVCRNCGFRGKAFPWCRSFQKAISDDGSCTRWYSVELGRMNTTAVKEVVPPTPVRDEHPTEQSIEKAHQDAIEENMRQEALAFAYKSANHAGYMCGEQARRANGTVKNPFRQYSPPAKEWARGYERGLKGLEEG